MTIARYAALFSAPVGTISAANAAQRWTEGSRMNERQKIDCAKEEDRKVLVAILAQNGYTVRWGREKRGSSNAYTHFVEYWKEGK